MNLEELRSFCLALPAVTEDVKWGADLCFCVGGKMFCVAALEGGFQVSFKVTDDDFDKLISTNNIIPAPYMARAKWISVSNENRFSEKEWQEFILASYEFYKNKLTKKLRAELGWL